MLYRIVPGNCWERYFVIWDHQNDNDAQLCVYSGLGKTYDAFPDTMFGGCKGLNKTKHAEMELLQEIFEFSGECFVPIGEVPF